MSEASNAPASSTTSQLAKRKSVRRYLSDFPTSKKFLLVTRMPLSVMLLHCDRGMSLRSSGLKNCVHGLTTRKLPQEPVKSSTVTYS